MDKTGGQGLDLARRFKDNMMINDFPSTQEWGDLYNEIQRLHIAWMENKDIASKDRLHEISLEIYEVFPAYTLQLLNNSDLSADALMKANDAMSVIAALYPYRHQNVKNRSSGFLRQIRERVSMLLEDFRADYNLEASQRLTSIRTLTDYIYT